MDVNDRVLRNIVVGLGSREDGVPRQTGFDITAASEVMAILALATSLQDLRRRLGRTVIGYTRHGEPVSAEDLKAAGAMTVVMREAIRTKPTAQVSDPAGRAATSGPVRSRRRRPR